MLTFLCTRFLQALFTLWVVSVLVFFSSRLTGSPDLALLPPDALPEHRQAFKQAYGLDKPLLVQYWAGSAGRYRAIWAKAFSTKWPSVPYCGRA